VTFERLLEGEDVPAGDQDFAGDRGLGGVGLPVPLSGLGVEPVPGVRRAPGVLCGLDRRPPQGRRSCLGDPAGPGALARLFDRGCQAGVSDQSDLSRGPALLTARYLFYRCSSGPATGAAEFCGAAKRTIGSGRSSVSFSSRSSRRSPKWGRLADRRMKACAALLVGAGGPRRIDGVE